MHTNNLRQERHRRRKEENRRFILGAAEAVFSKKGYSLASMDDIALQAGFSKATLYKYFRSKKDIFLDIIGSSIVEVKNDLETIASSELPAAGKLREYIRFIMKYYHGKENIIRIFFMEKHTLLRLFHVDLKEFPLATAQHPPIPKDIERSMEHVSLIMERILEEGIRSGEFRAVDVTKAAYVLSAIIRGFHFRGPLRSPGFSHEESADIILDIFFQGIKNKQGNTENKGE